MADSDAENLSSSGEETGIAKEITETIPSLASIPELHSHKTEKNTKGSEKVEMISSDKDNRTAMSTNESCVSSVEGRDNGNNEKNVYSNASDLERGDCDDCFEDEVLDKKVLDNVEGALPAEVVPKETESGLTVYGCSLCQKFYKYKKSAEYHIKVKHTAYSLICHVCEKTFKIKYDLVRHLNVHKGVRPHSCPECEKAFVCRSSLMRHRKLHHLIGDIYKCHNCDKTFRVETDLKRHMYTHTGERPWPCKLCTKSFVSKASLKVHEKIHDDSQKFACAVCHKKFHIKTDLVRHESVHTGDLKWECAVCQKKYSGKSAVKRHVRDAHIFGKVKYSKEMKVVDLLNSIAEGGNDLKEFSAFAKYNEDKSVESLLQAIDSFIIYKGGTDNMQADAMETNLDE